MMKNILYGAICVLCVILAICAIVTTTSYCKNNKPKTKINLNYITYEANVDSPEEAVDLFYELTKEMGNR